VPALQPYIPPKDADYDGWLTNFSALITTAPGTYGVTSGDATAIAAAQAAWHSAYLLVTSPSTKTATTVAAKDTQRVSSLAAVRPYAQQISLNPGVLTSNKIALGVNPRTSTPLPITTPTTTPNLTLQSSFPQNLILRYRDSMASPSVKAKPYGVLAAQIFGLVSSTPVTDPTLLTFLGPQTKSPWTQAFASGSSGKTVYLAARWQTRTGLVGPFSPIISAVIP
jgi:hypothetical protein